MRSALERTSSLPCRGQVEHQWRAALNLKNRDFGLKGGPNIAAGQSAATLLAVRAVCHVANSQARTRPHFLMEVMKPASTPCAGSERRPRFAASKITGPCFRRQAAAAIPSSSSIMQLRYFSTPRPLRFALATSTLPDRCIVQSCKQKRQATGSLVVFVGNARP